MKKSTHYFITVMLAICYSAVVGQPPTSLPGLAGDKCCGEEKLYYPQKASITDTTFCHDWDIQDNSWNPESISINSYDEEGWVIEEVRKNYSVAGEAYINASRKIREYYSDHALKTFTYQVWNTELNGGSWDNLSRTHYIYNMLGDVDTVMVQLSDYGNTEWKIGERYYYHYNESNLKDTVLRLYWHEDNQKWIYSYRYRYYYNDQHEMTHYYSDWANNEQGDFSLNVRTVYEQDPVNEELSEIDQSYFEGVWSNHERRLHSLDQNGLTDTLLYQNWNIAEMIWDTAIMTREIFSYNTDGFLVENIFQSHYFEWINSSKTQNEYDENNYKLSTYIYEWDHNLDAWRNNKYCDYPPPRTTTSLGESISHHTPSILPNPVGDELIIKHIPGSQTQIVSINVFDINNRLILQGRSSANGAVSFPVSRLKPGVYVVQMSIGTTVIAKKFVKK